MSKNFFSFDGRITRLTYFIMNIIIGFATTFCSMFIYANIWVIIFLPIMLMSFIVVKRCHDVNLSGWYGLLFAIPLANIGFHFYLLFKDGTVGPNAFGEDPKGRLYRQIKCPYCNYVYNVIEGKRLDRMRCPNCGEKGRTYVRREQEPMFKTTEETDDLEERQKLRREMT